MMLVNNHLSLSYITQITIPNQDRTGREVNCLFQIGLCCWELSFVKADSQSNYLEQNDYILKFLYQVVTNEEFKQG